MPEKEQKMPRRRLGFLMKLSIFFLGLALLYGIYTYLTARESETTKTVSV